MVALGGVRQGGKHEDNELDTSAWHRSRLGHPRSLPRDADAARAPDVLSCMLWRAQSGYSVDPTANLQVLAKVQLHVACPPPAGCIFHRCP